MTTNQIPDLSHRLGLAPDAQYKNNDFFDCLDTCLERVYRVALSLSDSANNNDELDAECVRGIADVIRLDIGDARAILSP